MKVDYKPNDIELKDLLKVFWEAHDPTQGMRQGNDIGSQYRSVVFIEDEADRNVVEPVSYTHLTLPTTPYV